MKKKVAKTNNSSQTAQKVAQIFRAFTLEHNKISLTEFNKITGLGISSLQRILSSLVMEGLLHRNEVDKRYELGLDFLFFAKLVEKNSNLIIAAKTVMEEIKEKTNETISLSILENNERKCIYQIESSHELRTLTYVGHKSPLYAGASAKVLLAYLTDEEMEKYFSEHELEPITNNTITNRNKLMEEIALIRKNGYAISKGERVEGAVSISTPIFDPSSRIIASLTILMPSVRSDDLRQDKIITNLRKASSLISQKL